MKLISDLTSDFITRMRDTITQFIQFSNSNLSKDIMCQLGQFKHYFLLPR